MELGTKTYKVTYRLNDDTATSTTRVEADSIGDAIVELRALFSEARVDVEDVELVTLLNRVGNVRVTVNGVEVAES